MRALKAFLLPGAICAAILYFSYHALAGEQGLAAWTQLQADQRALEAELEEQKALRAELAASLNRLRDATLDLDYVEELARTRLSYARPDEVLVAAR
jgi:cell division protein FtsB